MRFFAGIPRVFGIYKKEDKKRVMKGDKLRIKKIIESDRMNFAVNGQDRIGKDVTSVLDDYFTLTGPIALNISGKKGEYVIEILAKADGIKAFKVLP